MASPPDGALITPGDHTIYRPPIIVWVGDAAPALITVLPYGREGDQTIQYPTHQGFTVPVLVRRVLETGTTAAILIGQQAVPATAAAGPTADSTVITADSDTVTADSF